MNILGALTGGILGEVRKVIDEFHTSDEEKAELKLKAEDRVLRHIETAESAIASEMQSKERVLIAELQQGDTFTKRARPGVVWGGLLFIFINYVGFPVLARVLALGVVFMGGTLSVEQLETVEQLTAPLPDLPTGFWTAWGGICATWVIGRSAERRGVQSKLVELVTGNPPTQR